MSDIIASLIAAVFFTAILTLTWNQNLPTWCANPNVGGNAIVQPFCPVE